jgi:hypothetical protein
MNGTTQTAKQTIHHHDDNAVFVTCVAHQHINIRFLFQYKTCDPSAIIHSADDDDDDDNKSLHTELPTASNDDDDDE